MAIISIYYNKLASRSNDYKWNKQIFKYFYRHEVKFKSPSSLEEMRDELKKDVENKTDYVFSIGGDGTANEIIQVLAGTQTQLLIIPAGTANDLATQLGIKRNFRLISKIFQQKTTSKIDLISINSRLMATNGGIGIPYFVVRQVNHLRKKLPGFKTLMKYFKGHTYEMVLLKELLLKASIKYYKLKLESSDRSDVEGIYKTPMLLINNQSLLANHFNVAPKTNNSDGLFNVTIFNHRTKAALLRCILRIRSGDFPYDDDKLITFETNHIRITNLNNAKTLKFFGDGEEFPKSNAFEIGVSPKQLQFCSRAKEKAQTSSLDLPVPTTGL